MTIRARFSPDTRDVISTIAWLNDSGVASVETWKHVYDLGIVEVELHKTPSVLAYLSQIDDSLSISRITKHGIVFYLTDVPLVAGIPEDRRLVKSERADGFLFIPMSNIVCINTFGSVFTHLGIPA